MYKKEMDDRLDAVVSEVQTALLNDNVNLALHDIAEAVMGREMDQEAEDDPEYYATLSNLWFLVLARVAAKQYNPTPAQTPKDRFNQDLLGLVLDATREGVDLSRKTLSMSDLQKDFINLNKHLLGEGDLFLGLVEDNEVERMQKILLMIFSYISLCSTPVIGR
jgi:hypothetical protein